MPVTRIDAFDIWQPGYGGASVRIVRANTNTLADVFLDEDLTDVAANPQTLLTRNLDDIEYGKWAASLYTEQAYQLVIDSVDQTGIQRPGLNTLTSENVSLSVSTVDGGTELFTLAERFARLIDVQDYGEFLPVGSVGASAATNTASLQAATGAAAADGAGYVRIPAGTYTLNAFTLPAGVKLLGVGEGVTILQSTTAGVFVSLGGPRCGFVDMTLDGVSLVNLSIGVYGVAIDDTVFERCKIKRFQTGLRLRGGQRNDWQTFSIEQCVTGADLLGDLDAGNTGLGEPFAGNRWSGGVISLCTTTGINLEYVDRAVRDNTLDSLTFDSNTGTALRGRGNRDTVLRNPIWTGNTINLDLDDDTPADDDSTVIGFHANGGSMVGGEIELRGRLEDIIFEGINFSDVDITLTAPQNNVLALDCQEDGLVTLAGITTAWLRKKTTNQGVSSGLTTGNAATKAWSISLDSGQRVYLEAKVAGRQRNGTNTGFYHIAVSAGRPGATLAYDSQTANFTVGNILTGGTSGASGRIVADSDSGTTGSLTLQDVIGTFLDNEAITDGATGAAVANGTQSTSNAALVGSVTAIRAAQETDAGWDATFVANGPEIELRVTGASSQTVEWNCDVGVTSIG
jgi:hypothetical protein